MTMTTWRQQPRSRIHSAMMFYLFLKRRFFVGRKGEFHLQNLAQGYLTWPWRLQDSRHLRRFIWYWYFEFLPGKFHLRKGNWKHRAPGLRIRSNWPRWAPDYPSSLFINSLANWTDPDYPITKLGDLSCWRVTHNYRRSLWKITVDGAFSWRNTAVW